MRYRQDVPYGTNLNAVARHVVEHLAGAVASDDVPTADALTEVRVEIRQHEDPDVKMLSVIGEIPGSPLAPYLMPDFDPAADHPDIEFSPYENPAAQQFADQDAYLHWTTHGHHERSES